MKFVDEVTIEVASGHGGPGCVSFRREIFVPRGGPDGGDGGRGGNIIFKTSTRLHSLLDLKLKTKYRAQDGDPGKNQKRSGADGKDLIIPVPQGTIIKDMSGAIIKDLASEEEYVFLEGGIGGKGNPFYKTSVNQAPGVAQKGMPGKEVRIHLELKLLADIGIIGFPNAGKSTLISHISAAKPKIADYPFTTIIPNLGVVRFNEESNFIVADMPGLIKDAHLGVGLGTRFLKHIERTRCFVHLIDASGMSGRDPFQDYKDINHELKMYDVEHKNEEDFRPLFKRKQILALNKADVAPEEDITDLANQFKKMGIEVFIISAATGSNLTKLVNRMGEMVFNGKEDEEKDQKNKESFSTKIKTPKDSTKKTSSKKIKVKNKAKVKTKEKNKNKSKIKAKVKTKAESKTKSKTKGKGKTKARRL